MRELRGRGPVRVTKGRLNMWNAYPVSLPILMMSYPQRAFLKSCLTSYQALLFSSSGFLLILRIIVCKKEASFISKFCFQISHSVFECPSSSLAVYCPFFRASPSFAHFSCLKSMHVCCFRFAGNQTLITFFFFFFFFVRVYAAILTGFVLLDD